MESTFHMLQLVQTSLFRSDCLEPSITRNYFLQWSRFRDFVKMYIYISTAVTLGKHKSEVTDWWKGLIRQSLVVGCIESLSL